MPRPRKPKLKTVTIRLFADDVKLLKDRATHEANSWHVLARLLLHQAIARPRVIQ